MSSPPFFTQASNFGSAVSGGVDPRTGVYNVQIALGNLVGNRNLGPSLPLALSYSPLNWTDAGFGLGVSLGLTSYDTDNALLVLSTGEQYKVIETDTDVILQQQKLDAVHVAKNGDSYKVVHKSGDVEILTGPDNAFSLKVPTALLTPAGHSLALTWDFASGPLPLLTGVKDESDTLLTVDYGDSSKAVLNVLPSQSEGYSVEFWFENGTLASVHHFGLGSDRPLEWNFTSDPMGPQGVWGAWITGVSMPGGMSETVYYSGDGQGNQFPESAQLPALPYVTTYVQTPGGGQPQIKADYQYTDNDFLGAYSGISWDPHSDNLYGILTDYTYGSTETRISGGKATTITRTYNTYHLLTDETTNQDGFSRQVRTDYYAVAGRPFEDQPAQFQLPQKRTVTWTAPQKSPRSDVTTFVFDDAGNPVSQTDPDQTQTVWTFYPAGGSGSDCPPDPYGFTRWLKDVIRTPPSTDFDAAAYRTRYYYASHTTPDSRVPTVVLKASEQQYAGNQLLKQDDFTYQASGAEFGRIVGMDEVEYPDGSGGRSYKATHTFGFTVPQGEPDVLAQTHTLTTHDGLTRTRSQKRSRFTGRLRSATDPQGNVVTMTYDNLGRTLTRTANPGTRYNATATYQYEVGTTAPFVFTSTDVLGAQLRRSFDGAGRPIKTERKNVDGDGLFYVIEQLTYDDRGRTAASTASDRAPDGSTSELTRYFSYDDWGGLSTTTSDDGAGRLTQADPVALTTTVQQLAGTTAVTGRTVTTHNLRGEPVTVERFDLKNKSAGRYVMKRDGWGRVREATDQVGNTTRYDYDARGRLTRTTLADGTVADRGYAPFSADELTTKLTVNGADYGTQRFDGLGRLTATASGGRGWSNHYDKDSDPIPTTVTAPDQQQVTYAFIPELNNAVSKIEAGSITQRFGHDPVSGFLTSADEGGVTVARGYTSSGLPYTETTTRSGSSVTAQWAFTLNGAEYTYTGVDGATRQITRDGYGRIKAITDPAMQVSLDYDPASRLTGWTATDRQSGYALTTTLTFDDFNHEVKRTVSDNQSAAWTVTQGWQNNDLLSSRTITAGSSRLRDDRFTYSSRNQLAAYTGNGPNYPLDDRGNANTAQTFTYDGYGNITQCLSQFTNGSDRATYQFQTASDPCQLTGVKHTHSSYPPQTDLHYDAAGRLTTDDAGRTLTYDPLGRLRSTGSANSYGYDALNRLLTQQTDGHTSALYYRGESLSTVIEDGHPARLLQLGNTSVAQYRQGQTRLLSSDGTQTVWLAAAPGQQSQYAHTAYGQRPLQAQDTVLGFTGQRTDPVTGWYHLGNGARVYDPAITRFTTPDRLSPFGAGGINPYVYCMGDPINRIDPTGQLSWMAWLGIGLGVAGLALAVVTGGASIVAAGGLMAAWSAASTATLVVGALGVFSDITSILSGALETASPKASSILGWVSLGTGLGTGLGAAGISAARTATAVAKRAPELAEGAALALDRVRGLDDYPKLIATPEGGPMIVHVPETLHDVYDEDRFFTRIPNERNGNAIWTTEYRAKSYMTQIAAIDALQQRGIREIHILSGTHGARNGIRAAEDAEGEFLVEDRQVANYINKNAGRGEFVHVHDLSTMSGPELEEILTRPNAEIIAAFCYSRNDSAILRILGRSPTVSFVKQA